MKKYQILLFLLIIIIAVFFRFWQLNSIPPGLYPDVAINGIDAIKANDSGDYKLFYPDNNGREGLFINLIALSFQIFGISILSIKLVAAIIGSLTVIGLFLLAKELFNSQIALLSSFFLAISFWHINFSRISFRAIALPFILVWAFYFLYRGLRTHKIINFILAGIVFGLGFHTYIAIRIAPIILLIPLIQLFYEQRREQQTYKNIAVMVCIFSLFALLAALPLLIYFKNNPADFLGRTGQVSVFNAANPLKELTISTIKTFGMFNFYGDQNWRHNYAGQPLLPWPIGILFIIGLVMPLKKIINQIREKISTPISPDHTCQAHPTSYLLLITWFFVMLLPAILTTEGLPHALRAIGAIPPVFIFVGLGAWFSYNRLLQTKINKKNILVACLAFLITVTISEYKKYFIYWGENPATRDAFSQNYVNIGDYLNTLLPVTIKKYVIVNQGGVEVNGLPMSAQTVIFITTAQKTKNITYLLPNQIDQITADRSTVVIPLANDEKLFNDLKNKFPMGKINQQNKFSVFSINH